MLWIDADQRVRYKRVQANSASRGRADEDNKTFEQFQAEEAAEMTQPADGDDASLNMTAVKDRADIVIDNSNQDLAAFKIGLEQALSLS